jgi:branched-chain amino acid transport system permease protein
MIYAIAAASLNLILGYGGMVSFGHAAFFGIGSYVVGILYFHHAEETLLFGFIPGSDQFLITVPAAMLVAGLAALVIGGACIAHFGRAVHHDYARICANAFLPLRFAQNLWR